MSEIDDLRAERARLRSLIDRAATLLSAGFGTGKLDVSRNAAQARRMLREAVPHKKTPP